MIKSSKLGFEYVSLKTKPKIDRRTNILLESFSRGLITFDPTLQVLDYSSQEKWMKKIVNKIAEFCSYEDKGKKLYQSLCFGLLDEELESIKLINWENF